MKAREFKMPMRNWIALLFLKAAARLTTWGDPYDKINEAIDVQRRFCRINQKGM
jgi:hypothetical protein